MKTINVTIHPDGKTERDYEGFPDNYCLIEDKDFEIVGKVTKQLKKNEAYKTGVGAGKITVGRKK
jgi:hypothetical protein